MIFHRKWVFVFATIVIISLAVGIRQVFADGPSSEGEPAVPNDVIQNSELDPEVNALQVVVQDADTSVDSEGNPTNALPVNTYVEPVEEISDVDEPQAATATYFKRYPGIAFQPRDSDTGYDYFGSGCISAQGSGLFVLNLQLPTGAEIDFVRLYYYDSSSANARLFLTWYDALGGYSDIMSVNSNGSSGYGSVGASTSYIVDPINQAVALVWSPNTSGSSMALCGARIRYKAPFGASFLPVISNSNTGG